MGIKFFKVYELLKVTKITVFYGNNRIVFIKKITLDIVLNIWLQLDILDTIY